MMYEYDRITIDPLGDKHTRRVSVLDGGNWHRRSYRDEYYPIGRYIRTPYTSMSEDTEAAIRAIAQNWADRRQATFRWMCGRA